MFAKGASFALALAFQFASTNLVFELGIVLCVFIGWRFTLAELAGGVLLIALVWLGLRLIVTQRLEAEAQAHAEAAQAGHPTTRSRCRRRAAACWSRTGVAA